MLLLYPPPSATGDCQSPSPPVVVEHGCKSAKHNEVLFLLHYSHGMLSFRSPAHTPEVTHLATLDTLQMLGSTLWHFMTSLATTMAGGGGGGNLFSLPGLSHL